MIHTGLEESNISALTCTGKLQMLLLLCSAGYEFYFFTIKDTVPKTREWSIIKNLLEGVTGTELPKSQNCPVIINGVTFGKGT